MNTVANVIAKINEVTGLSLSSNETKFTRKAGRKFFNVQTTDRATMSTEFVKLTRYANTYKTITVQPNGLNSLAIFI